jgi:choline dehydrogenase
MGEDEGRPNRQKAQKPMSAEQPEQAWDSIIVGAGSAGCVLARRLSEGGSIRSRAGVEHPDPQYHFMPLAIRYDGKSPVAGHGFQGYGGPMRSASRGTVRLQSARANDAPVIDPNYMSHQADWQAMRAAIRLTREIFAQRALAPYADGEIAPGSEAELDAFISRAAESAYHPACTCGMGSG